MNYVVVISTLDDRSPHVWRLIEEAQQVATVVLVHTRAGSDPVDGTVTVRAEHVGLHYPRWANLGLAECDGPTALINDDVVITARGISDMLELVAEGYDLVTLPGRVGTTPITGWCFAVNPDVFTFDEEYRWYCSDDQFWEEAKRDRRRLGVANVAIVHDRGDHARYPAELRQAVQLDLARFRRTWKRGRLAR